MCQVRHIFDRASEQTLASAPKAGLDGEELPEADRSGLLPAESPAQPVLNALQAVADEHSNEVAQLCR